MPLKGWEGEGLRASFPFSNLTILESEGDMSIWIEIRCSENLEPTSYFDKCWGYTNDGPSGMATDTLEAARKQVQDLFKKAKRLGWKRIKGDWVCPHCVKILENKS